MEPHRIQILKSMLFLYVFFWLPTGLFPYYIIILFGRGRESSRNDMMSAFTDFTLLATVVFVVGEEGGLVHM